MIEILRKRRSVRSFKSKKLDPKIRRILSEALLRSPSSRGFNPWSFHFVDDPLMLKKLAQAKKHGSDFVAEAPLAVVITADESISDVWIEDCSIAAIILQLQAETLGLGSCWAQIRNRKTENGKCSEVYVGNCLGLDKETRVESIIAIGYPKYKPKPINIKELDYSKIIQG